MAHDEVGHVLMVDIEDAARMRVLHIAILTDADQVSDSEWV